MDNGVGALSFGVELAGGQLSFPSGPTWHLYSGDDAKCLESVPLLLWRGTFCDSFFAHARVFRTYQSWVLIMMLRQVSHSSPRQQALRIVGFHQVAAPSQALCLNAASQRCVSSCEVAQKRCMSGMQLSRTTLADCPAWKHAVTAATGSPPQLKMSASVHCPNPHHALAQTSKPPKATEHQQHPVCFRRRGCGCTHTRRCFSGRST